MKKLRIAVVPKRKVVAIVLCAVLCAMTPLVGKAVSRAVYSPKGEYVVVIDAGHGGIDGGVVGRESGVDEASINLAIAKQLALILADSGFGVVMTRTTDAGLYGAAGSGFKQRDMRERARIINGANADLMVSIHQNSFPSSAERGAQVFYRKGNAEGARLADCMRRQLNYALPCSDRVTKVGDYYVLNCTDVPAVLVECGFLSNAEDEANLLTDAYRERVAYTIYLGITSFL